MGLTKSNFKKESKKLKCSVCTFILTGSAKGHEKKAGDICPWCERGILELGR